MNEEGFLLLQESLSSLKMRDILNTFFNTVFLRKDECK